MAFTPTEIYMWLPDVVAVVVRDTPGVRNFITPVYQDESATPYDTWVTRTDPRDDEDRLAMVLGPTKNYLRFDGQLSTEFVDREEAKDAGNWTFSGGTITQVLHRCEPYHDTPIKSAGAVLQTQMQHTLLLVLDAPLTEGSYTVSNTAADIPSTPFVFNDEVTRAEGIRVNQVGYRPSDAYKSAFLAVRLTGGPNGGVVDFDDYSMVDEDFYVLDATKTPVYTGTVTLRVAPDDAEPGDSYDNIYVADHARPITVTSISNHASTPTVTTSGAHGLATSDRVRFRGMPTGFFTLGEDVNNQTGIPHPLFVITVTGANTFTIPLDTSGMGTYTPGYWSTADGGYDSLVYPCTEQNMAGTYVYDMDFSLFEPADATTNYYIQIPGYGISDPFLLHEAAHSIAFGRSHKGLYSLRRGIAVESGPYSRGPNFRDDGVTHFRNYRSNMTAASSTEEGTMTTPHQQISGHSGYAPFITEDRITLVDSGWGHQDAADVDTHLCDHMKLFYQLMMMMLDVPQASRITNFEVPLSSECIGSRYDGTDDWPPLMHECAWFMDFWLSLQQEDGSVLSGVAIPCARDSGGTFQPQSPHNEPSDLFHGVNSENFLDQELTGAGHTVHGAIMSPDHYSNYWAAAGFAMFSLCCADYGDTTLAATYRQAAIDAWDWAEMIHDSHVGDGVDRDAHYATYLQYKKMPVSADANGSGSSMTNITAVDTGADTVTINGSNHFLSSGTKVGVHAGSGALPGGLTQGDDYYVNVSGSTVSFHTSAADGGTGANKINLTAGFSAGPIVFRTMTDAQYETHMDDLDAMALAQARWDAAGAMFRLVGWDAGTEYATGFAAGVPNPDRAAVWNYMKTALAAGVYPGTGPGAGPADTADYAYGSEDAGGIRAEPGAQWSPTTGIALYNALPNIPSFPMAGTTAESFQVRGIEVADREADRQWRLLRDFQEEGHTTERDIILKNILAHVSFVQGANLTGKCFVQGAGTRGQFILLHDDAMIKGLYQPHGITGYAYFGWPITGTAYGQGPNVGSLNWVGHNVKSTEAAYLHTLIEPWKYTQSYWECQYDNQGLITNSEYSIGTSIISQMTVTLAAHTYDDNTIYTLGEIEDPPVTYSAAGLRFRWHT